MATWGAKLFEDELALEIRDAFEEALDEGSSVREATDAVLSEYEEIVEDEDEGPIVYVALAALQVEHDEVDPEFRDLAMEFIVRERGLERWEEADPAERVARERALSELIERFSML